MRFTSLPRVAAFFVMAGGGMTACTAPQTAPPSSPAAASPADNDADDALAARITALEQRITALEARVAVVGKADAPRPSYRRPGRPDPNTVYAVPIDGDPFVGPRFAPVTIVEAFEFACPFCFRARPTIEQLRAQYGNDIKVVFKTFIVHPQYAYPPAYAACAAHRQGRFKEMYEKIWKEGYENGRKLDAQHMETLASSLGLDMTKFRADAKSQGCRDEVNKDIKQLRAVGVRGTPTFYINGRPLIGAQPIDRFRAVIDEELAKARKSSIPVEQYYDHIIKTGVRSIK